jgi:hypothetical protein
LVPVCGGEYKEKVQEAEYSGNIVYSCMKWKNETCWNYSWSWGGW